MKTKKLITAFLRGSLAIPLLLLVICGSAQNNVPDSVVNFINTYQHDDTVKVSALLRASNAYQNLNLPKAISYASKAKDMAEKIGDKYYTALSLARLGNTYVQSANTSDALNEFIQEADIAKAINSNYLLHNAYNNIVHVYTVEKEWNRALQYSLSAIDIAQKGLPSTAMANSYEVLGNVYLGLSDDIQSEQFIKKAQKIFVSDGDTTGQALCFADLAKVYSNMRYYNLAKTQLDTALYLYKALKRQYSIALTYQQFGTLYLREEHNSEAQEYFNKALQIYNSGEGYVLESSRAYFGLGMVALGGKDYKNAIAIFQQQVSRLRERNYKKEQLKFLLNLAVADSAIGNYKEAYDYMCQYRVLNDTVNNDKANKTAQRIMIEAGVEHQNNDNKLLRTKYSEKQRQFIIIMVAGGLVLIGALYLILLYRQKNGALKAVEKLQEETSEKNRQMAITNGVKDKLISMIAHDVRSPLASVQNTLTLTREQILNTDEFMELSQMLEMDIQHLMGMLDNTLMWAREQMIDITIKKTTFSIFDAVNEVVMLYEQTINSKGVIVQNHIGKDILVISDKDIVSTVLRNIISNAIKFTPHGKNILIEQTTLKNKILISVRDEGVGISHEILNKINNKEFISTRGTDNEKGTGLGLLFSRDLLLKMGEDFQISSVPGKGTAVTISFDVKK